MRLPNGYGSVYHLSGNRRNPWAVRVTVGWNDKQEFKYIGYYPTKQEALQALAVYNATPDQRTKQLTFAEVYSKFAEQHFKNIKITSNYEKAYKKCFKLHDKSLADIKQSDLQAIIDNEKADQSKRYLAILFKQMWKYAERHQIVTRDQNRTEYLDVPTQNIKSDCHTKFTNSEMQILWDNSKDEFVQIILVLIYTGVRPMEFFLLKSYNVHDDYFHIEDGKTKNAIRDVPIHDAIKPFMAKALLKNISNNTEYSNFKYYFKKKTKELLGYEHIPGDCRHTFASMWAEQGLNEMYRRRIQGHSAKGIGEEVYTHLSMNVLIDEVNKLNTNFESNIIMHKNA